jgi:UDP:flavonoid glycosyltransferase YjiC (YdhE family)
LAPKPELHYESARAEVGLPPLGQSFIDTFAGDYLYLQGTVPSFEYPRGDLPEHLHFVGPFLPEEAPPGFAAPAWWPELDQERPVVLLTQGTVATDPRQLIVPALRALAEEPVLVLATSGGLREAVLEAARWRAAGERAPRALATGNVAPLKDIQRFIWSQGTIRRSPARP